jgi:hypothetical protein
MDLKEVIIIGLLKILGELLGDKMDIFGSTSTHQPTIQVYVE